MSYDFVTFGRTKIYYISESFEIENGIVDVIQPVNLGGSDSPDDLFVVRHKINGTQNEYERIYLSRKDIRFTYEDAKDLLIEKLEKNNFSQINHDETLIGDGKESLLGVNKEIIATKNDLENKADKTDIPDISNCATKEELKTKADKAITLAGYGITDAYTKEESDAKYGSVYHIKGSVASYNNLPENPEIGDVYNILDTGENYVWIGTEWDKLSETIDLTAYATTAYVEAREQDIRSDLGENISEVATAVSEKQDKLTAGSNIIIEDNVISVEEAHVYTPTVPTVDLQDKSIFNFTDDALATLSISVPEIINADFACQVNFSSGTTETAFDAPDTIKWEVAGDDIVSGAFVPAANKRYVLFFYSDGKNLRAISQGVE